MKMVTTWLDVETFFDFCWLLAISNISLNFPAGRWARSEKAESRESANVQFLVWLVARLGAN